MAKLKPSTLVPPAAAGLDAERELARRAAIAALLHRLNGGLNNAALAFELASSKHPDGRDLPNSAQTLDRGLAGVEQAARAATVLALLVDPTATPTASSTGPYAEDVVDILRAHARRNGLAVEEQTDIGSMINAGITPLEAAEALLAGLAPLGPAAAS